MKAISIRQPWAALIVLGLKNIENRTWPMPAAHQDEIVLVHAGKALAPGWPKDWFLGHWMDEAENRGVARQVAMAALDQAGPVWKANEAAEQAFKKQQARGGIIGAMRLGGNTPMTDSAWAEPDSCWWTIPDAWPLPFWPCKGALGFFDVPDYPYDTKKRW